jgi:RNA polymerase sigma-70 factor (ECF subfamily)
MELVWGPVLAMGQGEIPAPARDDAGLMALYAAGDGRAFEILYRRHRGPLYRYITRLRAADADAIFQDVWLAVIRGRGRYEPSARFSTFLFSIAHRRVIDGRRRDRPTDAVPEALPDTMPDPARLAEGAALGQALNLALDSLPGEQREAFLLRAEGGLSVREIADVTGVTYETAKSRLKYCHRALREKMENWK